MSCWSRCASPPRTPASTSPPSGRGRSAPSPRCAGAGTLGAEALTDHRALIGRIDCASVAVPTQHHHAVSRDLLEAGIDVLVEKPLTTTLAEGKALVELAARRGRVLQVGHLERFN